MKKLLGLLSVGIVLFWLSGCSGDHTFDEGNHRGKSEKKGQAMRTIRMSFGGDFVSESEVPLQRAEDGETFVGINVFRKETDKDGAKEEKYAFGLFNTYTGLAIDIITGYEYRFEATILIEHDDKLWDHGKKTYESPFRTQSGDFARSAMNKFDYTHLKDTDEQLSFTELKSGTAYVNTGSGMPYQYGEYQYPRVKRFYGEVSGFVPSESNDIEIPMNYKSFGLKFILESIPEGTSLTVMDNTSKSFKDPENDPEYYLQFPVNLSLNADSETSKSWESIYSLNNLSKDTETFKLRFTWNNPNGKSQNFTYTFNAEARKKKILKISIDGDVNQTKGGNLTCTQVDDTLEDEEDSIKKNY